MDHQAYKKTDNEMDAGITQGVVGRLTNVMVLDSVYTCGVGYPKLTSEQYR